jgi:hypothetical protein
MFDLFDVKKFFFQLLFYLTDNYVSYRRSIDYNVRQRPEYTTFTRKSECERVCFEGSYRTNRNPVIVIKINFWDSFESKKFNNNVVLRTHKSREIKILARTNKKYADENFNWLQKGYWSNNDTYLNTPFLSDKNPWSVITPQYFSKDIEIWNKKFDPNAENAILHKVIQLNSN